MNMLATRIHIFLDLLITLTVHAANNTNPTMQSLNVFKKPLALFSTSPMTGFHRDGYCRTSALDSGHHAVAGIVSDEFLAFSASRGNDLRVIPGMKDGCKWCLCTGRWLEAYKAFQQGKVGREAVPRVDLDATEDSVLGKVDWSVLREFAVKKDGNGHGNGNGKGEL